MSALLFIVHNCHFILIRIACEKKWKGCRKINTHIDSYFLGLFIYVFCVCELSVYTFAHQKTASDSSELLCGHWELNLGPLEDQ